MDALKLDHVKWPNTHNSRIQYNGTSRELAQQFINRRWCWTWGEKGLKTDEELGLFAYWIIVISNNVTGVWILSMLVNTRNPIVIKVSALLNVLRGSRPFKLLSQKDLKLLLNDKNVIFLHLVIHSMIILGAKLILLRNHHLFAPFCSFGGKYI